MRVKFWGTRGSLPTPGAKTTAYGGNTPCVEVRCGETLLIFDAGSGIRELGQSLVADKSAKRIHLLLSHTHWDHIQGLPFFIPYYLPDRELTIYGPHLVDTEDKRTLEQAVMVQFEYSFFPVRKATKGATRVFKDLEMNQTFAIDGIPVRSCQVRHPILALGYRIEWQGKTLVYATDSEPFTEDYFRNQGLTNFEPMLELMRNRYRGFVQGADLLIHDAQYTDAEYQTKNDWGHSTYGFVFDLAREAGVKRVQFFHHDPLRTDEQLARIEQDYAARAAAAGFACGAAAEGQTLEI